MWFKCRGCKNEFSIPEEVWYHIDSKNTGRISANVAGTKVKCNHCGQMQKIIGLAGDEVILEIDNSDVDLKSKAYLEGFR